IRRHRCEVLGPAHALAEATVALSVDAAVCDGGEGKGHPPPGLKIRRLPRKQPRERLTHRAEADQANANGRSEVAFHGGAMYGTRSSRSKNRRGGCDARTRDP